VGEGLILKGVKLIQSLGTGLAALTWSYGSLMLLLYNNKLVALIPKQFPPSLTPLKKLL
jgi:hypothetical protein